MEYATKLLQMLHILVNYQFTPDWVKDKDYLIYDRSDSKDWLKDFDQSKIIYTENIGQVDFDRLSYLTENYDKLPDVFLLAKSNLFKSITEEEYDRVKDNQVFTPLLTQSHKTSSDRLGQICYYSGGMYYERNDSWYMSQFNYKYFKNYTEFARHFNLPNPPYLPFAPGGNYILTKEVVHKYSRDYYDEMRSVLDYAREPAEAQMVERSLYNMWK